MPARTINEEAKALSKLYSDVDQYRRSYFIKENSEEDDQILINFVSPSLISFEEFRFYLYSQSEKKPLEPSLYYRPDYVSYNEYGTTNLWNLILFINDIPTIEEFETEEILVPSKSSVLRITRDAVKRNRLKELVQFDEIPVEEKAKLYYLPRKIPNLDVNDSSPVLQKFSDSYYQKEVFTLNLVTLAQRYVDLEYEPIENSVMMLLEGSNDLIYGKHYSLIKGNGNIYNRLTWDSRNIPNGVGLVGTLTQNNVIEVQYARKS